MYQVLYQRLRRQTGWCISIILPAEPGFQDHKMTHAVVTNAIREAEQQLREKGADEATIKEYMKQLDTLVAELDLAASQSGIGIFVGEDVAELVHFPFDVERHIVVDQSFEVRYLVYGMSQISEVYVLEISQRRSNVLLVSGEELVNLTPEPDGANADMPDPTDDWSFRGQRSDQEQFHQYLGQLDKQLGQYLNERKLPVVLAGSEENVNYFRNHSKYQDQIAAAGIPGNIEHLSTPQLFNTLAPIMQKIRHDRALAIMEEFRASRGASGLQTVWKAAQEGRVLNLLVETDYQQPAWLDGNGYELLFDPMDNREIRYLADAVDDLIEAVLERQGQVYFLEPGELGGPDKVAATLRY
jgi:hypothetical protein